MPTAQLEPNGNHAIGTEADARLLYKSRVPRDLGAQTGDHMSRQVALATNAALLT